MQWQIVLDKVNFDYFPSIVPVYDALAFMKLGIRSRKFVTVQTTIDDDGSVHTFDKIALIRTHTKILLP